jgi:hypothetical protein
MAKTRTKKETSWQDYPLVLGFWCGVCHGILRRAEGGPVCIQGHGGEAEHQPTATAAQIEQGQRVIDAKTMAEARRHAHIDKRQSPLPEVMSAAEAAERINAGDPEMGTFEGVTARASEDGKQVVLDPIPPPRSAGTVSVDEPFLSPAVSSGVAGTRTKTRRPKRSKVTFVEHPTTRLEQYDVADLTLMNVSDQDLAGAFVKVTAALRPSERESFDGRALKDAIRAHGAVAVLLSVQPMAEAPTADAKEQTSAAVRPDAAIAAWFDGLSAVPVEDREVAKLRALEILEAEGG